MKYEELPEDLCEQLIIKLFRAELLQQVAPGGFSNSQLVYVYHPRPEQYKEYRHSQLQLMTLQRRLKKPVNVAVRKAMNSFCRKSKQSLQKNNMSLFPFTEIVSGTSFLTTIPFLIKMVSLMTSAPGVVLVVLLPM